MANRGRRPSAFERRRIQTPGLPYGFSYAGGVEENIAAQAAEIERLVATNQRLLASHDILRREILAARQEKQRLQAHAASSQTEVDILIGALQQKIRKMEAEICGGENLKRELQREYLKGQSLVAENQELITEIQRVVEELEKAYTDIRKLAEMRAELDGLRKEYERQCAALEREKSLKAEQTKKMKAMEAYLTSMAIEAERLRASLANVPIPYGGIHGILAPIKAPSGHGDAEWRHGQGGGHADGVKGYGANPGASLGHGDPASCYEVHGMAQGQVSSGIGGGGLNGSTGKSVAGYSGGHGWMQDLNTAAAAAEEETNPPKVTIMADKLATAHGGMSGVSNNKEGGAP